MIALISALDTSLEQILYAARTPLGVRGFTLVTELGSGALIFIAFICVSLAFWRIGYLRLVIGFAVSVAGAIATGEILKLAIGRARPPVEWHAVVETGYSFPSLHSTAAMALYGFLIYATWKFAPAPWRMPLTLLFSAIILLVGFSRLYLGVHYPSDVVAGFAVGAIFLWLGILLAKQLSGRGSARG